MIRKKENNKNNLFRLKLEHENIPIVDQKVNGIDKLDNLFVELKKKFRGGK
jgi:hypothetical protein